MRNHSLIIAAVLAVAGPDASAQAIWRCGNSYSQQPCAGGSTVPAADPRTPAEAARASRVADTDARLAAQMEKARLAQERGAPKALVMGPVTPPATAASATGTARNGTKPKTGKLEQFTAVAPGSKPAKPKQKKKAAGA